MTYQELEKLKVLLISDLYPPHLGDLPQHPKRLASLLLPHLHTLEILTFDMELAPGTVTTEKDEGIPLYRLGIPRKSSKILEIASDFISLLQKKKEFHIFHCFHLVYAGFVGIYLSQYHHIQSILSLREEAFEMGLFNPSQFAWLLWMLKTASAIQVPTRDMQQKTLALLPSHPNIYILPDGIDPNLYQQSKRTPPNLPSGKIIATTGKLRLKYGLKVLLHAFQIAHKQLPQLQLLLAGQLPEEEQQFLQNFHSNTPPLRGKIHHLPPLEPRSEPHYFSTFDLYIASLRKGEPPLDLLKAMACEGTTLSPDMGGFREIIQHETNGYLFSPGNPRSLANTILSALNSPHPNMGKEARKTILQSYTLQSEYQNWCNLYQKLTQK